MRHDEVIKWKHFRVTGPLCKEFTGHPHKGQWRRALTFSLICAWTTVKQTMEVPVIWDAIALIMTSMWWHLADHIRQFLSFARENITSILRVHVAIQQIKDWQTLILVEPTSGASHGTNQYDIWVKFRESDCITSNWWIFSLKCYPELVRRECMLNNSLMIQYTVKGIIRLFLSWTNLIDKVWKSFFHYPIEI